MEESAGLKKARVEGEAVVKVEVYCSDVVEAGLREAGGEVGVYCAD